jgi:hypothetical protein
MDLAKPSMTFGPGADGNNCEPTKIRNVRERMLRLACDDAITLHYLCYYLSFDGDRARVIQFV